MVPVRRYAIIPLFITKAVLVISSPARAQLAPPAQDYVTSIYQSPLKAPATADFAPSASFTMEGWFFLEEPTPSGWMMGKNHSIFGVDPFISFVLYLDSTGTKVRFGISTGAPGSARAITAAAPLPLRVWTHVACVLDGTTMRLYINGVSVATGTALGSPQVSIATPLGIGSAFLEDGRMNYPGFRGYARQLRFWNIARESPDIATAVLDDSLADRRGLVASWPLDELGGQMTSRDISGSGRNLTSKGTVVARTRILALGPLFSTDTLEIPGSAMTKPAEMILIDFDSDGDLDLIIPQRAAPSFPETRTRLRAFRNDSGKFVDVTDSVLGEVTMVHPRDWYVGDLNGDGRSDLLIVGHGTDMPPFPGEQSKLLIQTSSGKLSDETTSRLPQRLYFTHGVAVGDIDGDGDLDIYLSNLGQSPKGPRFYINDGKGVFTDAVDRLPADIASGVLGFTSCLLQDVNGDRLPDLILGAGGGAVNELLINNGRGGFYRDPRYALPPKLLETTSTTVAIRAADFDSDGKTDLLLSTTGGSITMSHGLVYGYEKAGLQLLLNRGDGTFADATAKAGFTWTASDRWVVWPHIVDLDGDGRPDIIAQMGGSPHRLFCNLGGGRFFDASEVVGSETGKLLINGTDVDRDGRTDIITASASLSSGAVTVSRSLTKIEASVIDSSNTLMSRLANLSLLTKVSTADPMFTLGAVLGGGGTSGSKPLLIRAVGPSLAAFGISDALKDPQMELFSGGRSAGSNDNWSGAPVLSSLFSQVGAFPYSSSGSLDSALAYTPNVNSPPLGFTVQIGGVSGSVGSVLAEVYDGSVSSQFNATTPRLINVSVLKSISSGEILTAGFVIQGLLPKKVLVRAVGPTLGLPPFGIPGAMSDPKMELFLGQTAIASNDNWGGTSPLSTAFNSVGAFSLGASSKDAALVVNLNPGNYTVQVSGAAGSSGLAIVEVYEVP